MSTVTAAEARGLLRDLHRAYVRACGSRFAHARFCARAVPGWRYYPADDRVEREVPA